MSFVHVAGWLRTRKRRPGHPDNELPGEGEHPDIDPPEGGGEYPEHPIVKPPPGIWPPPPSGEVAPPIYLPPGTEPGPPGTIWPPPGPDAQGKYLVACAIAVGSTGQVTFGWTVVDTSLKPGHELPEVTPPAPTPH